MIIGIGHDLVSIDRIARVYNRFGDHFLMRSFAEPERQAFACLSQSRRITFLAKRFAAKEAAAKALGTGFRDGILMQQIFVHTNSAGAPVLNMTGAAAHRLNTLLPAGHSCKLHLSLSDEPPYAAAFVVLEAIVGL